MKSLITKTFFVLTFCFTGQLMAVNPDGYNIKITVKGLKEGSTCLLANYYGDKQYIKDSGIVNNKGEVIFKGDDKYPQGVYLFVPPNKKYFDFIMDDGQNFSLETDTTDYIKEMKVKGSVENKIFYEYQLFMAGKQKQIEPLRELYKKTTKTKTDSTKLLLDQMTAIDKEVKDFKANFIKNNPNTFVSKLMKAMEHVEIPEAPILSNGKKDSTFAYRYYKAHFFDNMDFSDDRMVRTPIFHSQIKEYMDKMTAQIPDSINVSADYLAEKAKANPEVFKYIVYWLTYTYESSNIMGMDAVFVHMVEQYYVTKQAYWVDSAQLAKITNRAYTLKPLLLGKKAPPITMLDSAGTSVSLYNVKGSYTIVVFWDHGCGHCKKEIPKLAEVYKTKLKAKGIKVYAIETEDKPAEWKKFINEHKLDWINVHQPDAYQRAVTKKIYDIYSTPVIYVLDENKIIKAKRIDSEQISDFIDALEKEKNKAPKK
ncbi:MAG: redoxin domain-containing protein [Bacteroidia bacterium]|jgi:peroxiredoxin